MVAARNYVLDPVSHQPSAIHPLRAPLPAPRSAAQPTRIPHPCPGIAYTRAQVLDSNNIAVQTTSKQMPQSARLFTPVVLIPAVRSSAPQWATRYSMHFTYRTTAVRSSLITHLAGRWAYRTRQCLVHAC